MLGENLSKETFNRITSIDILLTRWQVYWHCSRVKCHTQNRRHILLEQEEEVLCFILIGQRHHRRRQWSVAFALQWWEIHEQIEMLKSLLPAASKSGFQLADFPFERL